MCQHRPLEIVYEPFDFDQEDVSSDLCYDIVIAKIVLAGAEMFKDGPGYSGNESGSVMNPVSCFKVTTVEFECTDAEINVTPVTVLHKLTDSVEEALWFGRQSLTTREPIL